MTFSELRKLIRDESKNEDTFINSGKKIQAIIFALPKEKVIPLILDIGTIPEDIGHDSSEEKLYAKAADILLSKAFQMLGLKSTVNQERANCADVFAKSDIYNYTLVGDAKAFRLSRTAKNQKDFKVSSMVSWRGDNDYAVLVCPYYQYPNTNSQIYGQALNGNICLLGWEHFVLFLKFGIQETKSLNLSSIWNTSSKLSESVTIKDRDRNSNFHNTGNTIICESINIEEKLLTHEFAQIRKGIIMRGEKEIEFWTNRIEEIKKLSKEEAITELISALKLNEKIVSIKKYIRTLR